MVKPLTLTVVEDSFAHVAVVLVVPSEVEACLGVVSAQGELRRVLDIPNVAEESNTTAKVLCLTVKL